mmetsp:Transcript_5168/g.5929  ORF Transcript_5168/g.5929 Transcript_5168/m.5929 type:complete len:179 (+) Transcript_5168:463-999(+)
MVEFPDIPFNMELKNHTQDIKVEVLKLIRKYNRAQLTIWGSVKEDHCLACKAMAPDIPTFTPIASVQKILLYLFTGFLPFYNIPYDTFQFPFVNEDYINYKYKYDGTGWYTQFYIKVLKLYNLLGLVIFFHLRRRGIYVFYYSINQTKDIDTCMAKYVDGIITDSPTVLVNHIAKKDI